MLDREEDAALAEIEAALRRDDPEFVELLEGMDRIDAIAVVPTPPPEPIIVLEPVLEPTRSGRLRKVLGSVALVVAAVAVTLVTAVLLGPDIGGLVGVVSSIVAGMVVYQWARGCPGFRRRRA